MPENDVTEGSVVTLPYGSTDSVFYGEHPEEGNIVYLDESDLHQIKNAPSNSAESVISKILAKYIKSI